MKDKTKWGDGPWQSEPDEERWKDWESGYQCLALRGPVGAWCGYVGVPKDHPAAGLSYYTSSLDLDDVLSGEALAKARVQKRVNDISAHGGLTYAGESKERGADFYWFGFDCAHCDDWCPSLREHASKDYLAHCGPGAPLPWGGQVEYRTLDYVKGQCASVARQLHTIARDFAP